MKTKFKHFLFSVLIIGIFCLLPYSIANADNIIPSGTPTFTKTNSYNPNMDSEPINLYWAGESPSDVVSKYIGQGWNIRAYWPTTESEIADWSYWGKWIQLSLQLDPLSPNFGIDVAFVGTNNVSTDLTPNNGNSGLTTNYDLYSITKNEIYTYPVGDCDIHVGNPISRDHFRIWQYGSDTIGSASYDNGVINDLTTEI